ncbi:MAG: hypothetical protein LBU45_03235 [Azoarcus sp.]|nr:hypothetical protein [Azoarcus sp.]
MKVDIFEETGGGNFKEVFNYHLGDFYHQFLKINFKKYEYGLFARQKGRMGS